MTLLSAMHSGKLFGWSPKGQITKMAGLTGPGKPKPAEANKMAGDTPVKADGLAKAVKTPKHMPVLSWPPAKNAGSTPKPAQEIGEVDLTLDSIISSKFQTCNSELLKKLDEQS